MARSEIIWAFAGFVVVQLLLSLCIESFLPRALDEEYVAKRELLQDRIGESPSQPLAVVLGTSRTEMALNADLLNRTSGSQCVTFNLGFEGTGTMFHRVCLRRLREDGIRPDLLFIEVVPFQLLVGDRCPVEERWLNAARLRADEVAMSYPVHTQPWRMMSRWAVGRALPCMHHRLGLRHCLALDRFADGRPIDAEIAGIDRCGWRPFAANLSKEKTIQLRDKVLQEFTCEFVDPRLSSARCQLLRDLLEDCRRDAIPTALILMPEGTIFRNLYPEGLNKDLDGFLADLKRENQLLAVIDARTWINDTAFVDPHHLGLEGARQFTERFGAEWLTPLLSRTFVTRR
jgi:hypothetical protein